MTFEEYADDSQMTQNPRLNERDKLIEFVMGLCGEAGETSEMIKKMLFHGRAIDLENFSKEMGDVLWYWTNLALAMNLSPSEIAQENIRKLKERYPERWSNDR